MTSGVWEPKKESGKSSTIVFYFEKKVNLVSKSLSIYENYQPGSIRRISIVEEGTKIEIYSNNSPSKFIIQPRIWKPDFKENKVYSTKEIEIEMFTSKGSQISGISLKSSIFTGKQHHHLLNKSEMPEIFEKKLFCDMEIILDQNIVISCHKIVLSRASQYFDKLLKQNSKINIPGYSKKLMELVLKFLYFGNVFVIEIFEADFISFCEQYEVVDIVHQFPKLSTATIIKIIARLFKINHFSLLKYMRMVDFIELIDCECFEVISEELLLKMFDKRKERDENIFIEIFISWGKTRDSFKKNGNLRGILDKFIPLVPFDRLDGKKLEKIKKFYPELLPENSGVSLKFSQILDESQIEQLISWIKKSLNCGQVDLIPGYQGSRDGFGASDFHKICDPFSQSLVVICCEDKNIFGGFSEFSWDKNEWNNNSKKSFLFSLKNPSNKVYMMKAKRNTKFQIVKTPENGPIFGMSNLKESDLFISNYCSQNHLSNFHGFPTSFEAPVDVYDAQSLFTGNPRFRVKEIEVFEVKISK
jgi:hypothetical protein